ncbi:MAG TPA: type 1 glutamine amidotransferase domain-containing protein [Microbacterium sp.]|nr:type 1 glutamine amidotransferase domain-containing protein [Microbacterium sp.]
MAQELEGKKVAFVLTDGFEDSEFSEPWKAVTGAGATAHLVAPHSGEVKGEKGFTQQVDLTLDDADADDYDALVIPGGVQNADDLRVEQKAVAFAKAFFEAGKPVGVICHGPWLLVEADVVRGRTLTSWPSLQTDLRNAGATWVDEEVETDKGLVSSRNPGDLPAFCAKVIEEIQEGVHEGQHA